MITSFSSQFWYFSSYWPWSSLRIVWQGLPAWVWRHTPSLTPSCICHEDFSWRFAWGSAWLPDLSGLAWPHLECFHLIWSERWSWSGWVWSPGLEEGAEGRGQGGGGGSSYSGSREESEDRKGGGSIYIPAPLSLLSDSLGLLCGIFGYNLNSGIQRRAMVLARQTFWPV